MNKSSKRSPKVLLWGIAMIILILATFSLMSNQSKEDKSKLGRKDAPVLVSAEFATTEDIPVTISAIGNVEALETIAIQSQIGGQLRKAFFKQGDFVNKGQPLFEIDPRLQTEAVMQANAVVASGNASIRQSQATAAKSAAAVQMAQAALQRDQAQLVLAKAQEERYRNLLDKNYVTREQYDQMKSALGTAQATITSDQASIQNAQAQLKSDQAAVQIARASTAGNNALLSSNKIQLGFTKIVAPVSGKTGQILVNVGNVVQPNTSTLVSIARLTPILVAFSIPEKNLLSIQQAMKTGKLPVQVTVPGNPAGSGEPENGKLVFIDNTVDVTSGTVRLKGEFENKKQLLWPGRFVDVMLQLGIQKDAVVIPAVAVQKGQQGHFVYVIRDGRAEAQNVVVDRIFDGKAIIQKGINANVQVVTDGQMRLAPKSRVKIAPKS